MILAILHISLFATTHNVISNSSNEFLPTNLSIDVGDTVVFTNTGGFHNVNGTQTTYANNNESFGYSITNWGVNVGSPSSSWTYTHVFTVAGTYTYQCDPHVTQGMIGTISVNQPTISGCTDSTASNYNSNANVDDGSCLYNSTFASDLFISEYAEGSSFNKYIEIYNGTGQSVDLSNYQIWKISNGGSWSESTLSLSGTILHDDVYIICHSSSNVNPFISSVADITWSQANYNGDDAIGLAKRTVSSPSNFVLIDAVGQDGTDPGAGWSVAGESKATQDRTLVRKCDVTQGNTNWSLSAGTNPQDSEWEVFPIDDWNNINQHTFPCQASVIYGCIDSTALNFDPNANSDDGSCLYPVFGCMNSLALNYDSLATNDNGSCCFVSGCTDNLALNYDSTACYDDGSCIMPVFGCMDINAMNYDSLADASDGSCVFLSDKVDLFFSEYGEGTSDNKWLEIYNSSSQNIDLTNYALARVSNDPTTIGVYEYWIDFPVGSQILAGDVFVVAHALSSNPTPPYGPGNSADWFYAALSNGDDGFALVYGAKPSTPTLPGSEYVILDMLGDFNGDPGSGWSVAGVSNATKDHTLVRKCDVTQGNTDWTLSAGTDIINSEWIVMPNDDWSDIGVHTTCTSISYGCTDSTALNYNSSANTDDGSCIAVVNGCTDSTAFNFNSSANTDDGSCVAVVNGCTDSTAFNYNSLANTDDGSCLAPMVNLFISEYAEGSSNNKYLEIYNPTSDTVDLSAYAYPSVSNGANTVGNYDDWNDFDAGAVILPNNVYIIAHPSADPAILSLADETHYNFFNGDDGYALVYGDQSNYTVIDWLGDFGVDPGSAWDVAGISNATKDHTLIRKCNISQGNSDWISSAGTDSLNSEWLVLPNNDWSNIGQHSVCNACDNIQAAFNISDFGCLGDTITFFNLSTSADPISTYFWDFGDGNTSSSATPSHIYLSSNISYTASLVVIDINGCSDTAQNTTFIYDNPTVYFSYPSSSNIGSTTITFDNLSNAQNGDDTTTMLFSWFVNGQLITNSSNFTYTFAPISGDTTCYIVQLLGENQYGCIDSVETSICVFPINNSIIYGCTDSLAINYFVGE